MFRLNYRNPLCAINKLKFLLFFACVLQASCIIILHTKNNCNNIGGLFDKNPITSSNPAVRGSETYHYRIFVFTYNRPEGLRETLSSLLNADYSKARGKVIDLNVFMDYGRQTEEQVKNQLLTLQILQGVTWPHGRYTIHQRYVNVGLRYSIMEAWQPASNREVGAFFEDDVVVSPYWFSWISEALARYAPLGAGNATTVDANLIGFSLFRPIYDQLSNRGITVDNNYAPFLLQQPCSWGAVYLPEPWKRFREFFDKFKESDIHVKKTKSRKIPQSNSWDYRTSWKKYLIYHMHVNGLYMLYPNLPRRLVLSTSRLLKGEHRTPPKKLFLLPVVVGTDLVDPIVRSSLHHYPDMEAMLVYDVMFDRVPNVKALAFSS